MKKLFLESLIILGYFSSLIIAQMVVINIILFTREILKVRNVLVFLS